MALTKVTSHFITGLAWSKITGAPAFITGITSSNVTTALGFTPYSATNPDSYITGITFANVSTKPTTLSGYGITDAQGTLIAGTNITISGSTISSTDTNTTYSVGDSGLTQKNFTTTLKTKLDGIAASATNVTNTNQLTNGAGYITTADGGNAGTLDGIDSSQFLRSDTGDTMSSVLTMNSRLHFIGGNAIWLASNNTAKINIDARSAGDGAQLHKWNRNHQDTAYLTYYEQWYDGSSYHSIGVSGDRWKLSDGLDVSGTLTATNLTVGSVSKSSDTFVRVLANDSHEAGFEAFGNNQGTGYLYVGQTIDYGGGISYNGDGSPSFITGETNDHITFFRRDNGTNTEVFHYAYSSNNVNFNGDVRTNSSNSRFKAAYNTTDSYHGSYSWHSLQLGNNGDNRIVGGRTATGGNLKFYVNNTNDASTYATTPNGILALTIASDGDATFNGSIALGGATIANGYLLEITAASGNIMRSTRGTSKFSLYQYPNSDVCIGTTSNNRLMFLQNDGNALCIDTSKNVGIGVTSVPQQLTIGGRAAAQMTLLSSTTGGDSEIYFGDSGSSYRGAITYHHNGDYMRFHANGSEKMRILANGKVGVGTIPGHGHFEIKTASAIAYSPTTFTDHANLRLVTGGSAGTNVTTGITMAVSGSAEAYIGAVQNSSNHADIVFQTYDNTTGPAAFQGYSEKLRISSYGHIAIPAAYNATASKVIYIESGITGGASTYQGSLLIQAGGAGSDSYGGAIRLKGHAHATDPGSVEIGLSAISGAKFTVDSYGAGGGADLFTVLRSGNVLIGGTSDGGYKLNVTGGEVRFQAGARVTGNFQVSGTVNVSGTKNFYIDHPLESKKDTHSLIHSSVESPEVNNLYRGKVDLVNGTSTVNLDTESNMTEGTFVALNDNTQCFTTNETDWDAVRGSVDGNRLTISCQNSSSTANVSWMVIANRKDNSIINSSGTNSNGELIVEPIKTLQD